eukprot:2982535-Rhodomonas_salina.1
MVSAGASAIPPSPSMSTYACSRHAHPTSAPLVRRCKGGGGLKGQRGRPWGSVRKEHGGRERKKEVCVHVGQEREGKTHTQAHTGTHRHLHGGLVKVLEGGVRADDGDGDVAAVDVLVLGRGLLERRQRVLHQRLHLALRKALVVPL